MNTRRLALCTALALASFSTTPALAGGPPPQWNRRIAALHIEPSLGGGPGTYDVHADVFVSRHDTTGAVLVLDFLLALSVGGPNPIGLEAVAVEMQPSSPPCSELECSGAAPCAVIAIDGVPRDGQCRPLPPHFGDDVDWCGCSTTARVVFQQVALVPGTPLSAQLFPDGAGLAEIHTPDDQFTTSVPAETVTTFCFGDGSGTPCPCGNDGYVGQACRNSTHGGAVLGTLGSASVLADDLLVRTYNLPVGQPTLLFTGDSAVNGGAGVPFGDGLRCVGTNVVRVGTVNANANGVASWGPGLAASEGWQVGDVVHAQAWFRDPIGGPCGELFNLSNGLRVELVP